MRINIDLPDDVALDYNVQAAKLGTDRKNYIQSVLVTHASGGFKDKKPFTKRKLKNRIMLENENLNEPQKPQLNIGAVISSALPCPFCGEKPKVDKSYMPSEVEISCVNNNCHARPSVYESVQCVENKGDTVTYSPMFEWHWQSVLDKWNTRHCL